MTSSIPAVLASGAGLHTSVRVELTNGAIILGRLVEMDPATMNLKIDALSATAVHRTVAMNEEEVAAQTQGTYRSQQQQKNDGTRPPQKQLTDMNPLAMQCIQSVVVRGACVKFIDYLPDDGAGSNSVEDVLAAVSHIRPAE